MDIPALAMERCPGTKRAGGCACRAPKVARTVPFLPTSTAKLVLVFMSIGKPRVVQGLGAFPIVKSLVPTATWIPQPRRTK